MVGAAPNSRRPNHYLQRTGAAGRGRRPDGLLSSFPVIAWWPATAAWAAIAGAWNASGNCLKANVGPAVQKPADSYSGSRQPEVTGKRLSLRSEERRVGKEE